MKCRYCGNTDSKVIDSRPSEDGTSIRRRRECTKCGKRFTTFERIEENPMMVVKRDGRREPMEREKIAAVIRKACGKRPISADVQNRMVDDIVREASKISFSVSVPGFHYEEAGLLLRGPERSSPTAGHRAIGADNRHCRRCHHDG